MAISSPAPIAITDETGVVQLQGTATFSDPDAQPGPTQSVVRDLTAAEIATLASAPVELIPSQGGGTVIVPVSAVFQYVPGTVAFGSDFTAQLEVGGDPFPAIPGIPTDGLVASVRGRAAGSVSELAPDTALTLTGNADPGAKGSILTSALAAGGTTWLPGDTANIDSGNGDAVVAVDSVGNSFPITAVNQGGKTFTVTGDASGMAPTDTLSVYRSTGNDGGYTIVSAIFGAGSTVITVVEAIPSAVADGAAGDSTAGGVGVILTYTLTDGGTEYVAGTGDALLAIAPSVGEDASVDVLTVSPALNGTGRVEVLYTIMRLLT